jgi:hypothetical protein
MPLFLPLVVPHASSHCIFCKSRPGNLCITFSDPVPSCVITHTGYDMIDPEVLASYVHVPPADCEIKIYESNKCVQRWRRCAHVTVIGSVGFSAMTEVYNSWHRHLVYLAVTRAEYLEGGSDYCELCANSPTIGAYKRRSNLCFFFGSRALRMY